MAAMMVVAKVSESRENLSVGCVCFLCVWCVIGLCALCILKVGATLNFNGLLQVFNGLLQVNIWFKWDASILEDVTSMRI